MAQVVRAHVAGPIQMRLKTVFVDIPAGLANSSSHFTWHLQLRVDNNPRRFLSLMRLHQARLPLAYAETVFPKHAFHELVQFAWFENTAKRQVVGVASETNPSLARESREPL